MAEYDHAGNLPSLLESIEQTGRYLERHWFAVYTTCRHEKRVALHFKQRGIEFYLPLYRVQRRWKDRSAVSLDLPLFPCYIFVRMDWFQRLVVLQVPGVLSVVGGTWPRITPLPELEVETLRRGLDPMRAEPHALLLKGERARIFKGPLAGLEGIVVRKKNEFRVVLTLDLIMQSISVEVNSEDLEPVFTNAEPGPAGRAALA
ncbi:MAG TPA: UpxY family transcription antiterminator [Terracidiphilus sp.]|nr:UpxY family transcription antiterminator [Terracidiphilus sp.]